MSKNTARGKRFLLVSNRLPVTIRRTQKGLRVIESPGGLATGLRTLQSMGDLHFIGWPGLSPENDEEKKSIIRILRAHKCHPVFLSSSELEKFYYGFSNRTLWPLFHYFSTYCTYEEAEWTAYKKANQKFLAVLFDLADDKDIFWIHDYHLMLLPSLIRQSFPRCSMGYFLHIPFPSSEIFRLLPWRKEILEGLMGADLIGFHTYEYARHFMSSVLRLLGYEHELGWIQAGRRRIKVDNFPMGIDIKNVEELLYSQSVIREIQKQRAHSSEKTRKIVLSVDRLDYTKGIPQRLESIEYFLSRYTNWHNKFIVIMLCVPSRTKVKQYSLLKEEVDRLVGRINGLYGRPDWIPIHYMYRSLPFNKLLSLYSLADVALVTPLRDGMNLVAKEYIASKTDNRGVLILSETAGAAAELGEALVINVNNKEDMAEALERALEMKPDEQETRMKLMRGRLHEFDIFKWTKSFVDGIEGVKRVQAQKQQRSLDKPLIQTLVSKYKKSRKRLLLLDYDGTLISFTKEPDQTKPDLGLKRLLISLAKDPYNELIIVSGRDRFSLEKWLGMIPGGLIAEHGAWIRTSPQATWNSRMKLSTHWKQQIRPILNTHKIRVPGSFVEEKEFGMAWHYRKANPELGELRAIELYDYLNDYLSSTELQVIHGNKVIEVRMSGINKGEAAQFYLGKKKWDFILAMGDDWTDEDIFKILPSWAFSVKVGFRPTQARFYLESPEECRMLLQKLSKIMQKGKLY